MIHFVFKFKKKKKKKKIASRSCKILPVGNEEWKISYHLSLRPLEVHFSPFYDQTWPAHIVKNINCTI